MTPRQQKLLKAIIDEFVESAEAVGSINLLTKYGWDISSATIRNEMAELMRMGYLTKPHTSAGRVPTTLAYKSWVDAIFDDCCQPNSLKINKLVADLLEHSSNIDELINYSLQKLENSVKGVAFALINDRVYHIGLSSLFDVPEYKHIEKLYNLIHVIEDRITLKNLLEDHYIDDKKVRILFGSDLNIDIFLGTSIIYGIINAGIDKIFIGVIGPERIDYSKVVPSVLNIANALEIVVNS